MHSRPVETLQLLVVLLLTCNCVAILNLNGVLSRLDFSLRGNSRPPSGRVTGLQLLYSISDTKVADLVNGTVFVVNEIPGMSSPLFSVQATVTAGSNIRSIQFGWNNNSNARIESRPPYALCGNSGRDFVQCPRLGYGVHTISATPFAGRRAKGQAGQPLVVTFSIVSNRNGAPIPPSAAPKVAPSPTGFPPTPVSNQIVTPLSPMAAPTVAALPPTRVVAPISVQIPPVQAPVPAPLKSPIAPTRFPIAPTRSPIAPTRSPIVPAPVVAPVVQSPTTPQTCSIPKLVGSWDSGKLHPFTVAEAQGAMIGTNLVIVGGFLQGYNSVSVQTQSWDTNNPDANWLRMDDYPFATGVTHAAFVVVGTKFYMCGGYAGGGIGMHTDVCMVYDHSKQPGKGEQWSTFTSLPDGGRAGGHMVHDRTLNALIFSGGASRPQVQTRSAKDHKDTWMYSVGNPSAGWVSKAPLPFFANHMSAVTAKDGSGKERHYWTGGQLEESEHDGNLSDHYEYDAINNVWYKRKFMSIPRSHHASSTRAIGCGFIVVAGCTNGGKRIADVSYYDIPTDTWTKIGDLTDSINTPVCDISNGVLHCNTGWDGGNFSKKIQIAL